MDGEPVDEIHADLTAKRGGVGANLTRAGRQKANAGVAFMGDTKGGPFDIAGDLARAWLRLPANPNGRPNADVLKPWANGMDLTRRPSGKWIVDFRVEHDGGRCRALRGAVSARAGARLPDAATEPPRDLPRPLVAPRRTEAGHVAGSRTVCRASSRPPTVAKHRLFAWQDVRICPDHQLIVIARDDDTTFGILHSRFHEAWSLRLGTWLGKGNDPRYTPTTTFETFPFPDGLSPDIPAADYAGDPRAVAIAEAARRLVELRDRWLNPPEWVEWVDEPVPGYPKRPVARNAEAEKALRARTLTNLYNTRPQWLADAHAALDAAVAAAYGWDAGISDEEALAELLALNLELDAPG